MWLIESFKKRKLILFNIFLTIYVITNLVGGERGLVSYFEKKDTFEKLNIKKELLNTELNDLKHKINMLRSNNFDYLDMLYREKLKYGKKEEIIIKLK